MWAELPPTIYAYVLQ